MIVSKDRQARSIGITTIVLHVCECRSIHLPLILLDLKKLISLVLDFREAHLALRLAIRWMQCEACKTEAALHSHTASNGRVFN